jgi:glycosyltransferase involved in cell wall biosynthesis
VSRILINGYFLCRALTGIERYAYEVTKRLDRICERGELSIMVPSGRAVPSYQNITVIKKKRRPHLVWQFFTLQFFLLTHRSYTVIDFGNTCLPLAPGLVFLHDIYCELFPRDFRGFRDRLGRFYYRLQYRLIARLAKKIITVSEFSRAQIAKAFHLPREKIAVIPNGWEHFKDVLPDYAVFEKYPLLEKRPFFFTLGSLSKRKNLSWIRDYAQSHPGDFFVISGSSLEVLSVPGLDGIEAMPNILFTGRLADGEVKALMEKCRAFIFPSYYEGFGIPPLEALSCGAKIVIAASSCLPEIYGKTARYIDPFNADIDLEALLALPVEPPDRVLAAYSYDGAAAKLLDLMRTFTR